ncbi:site-specific integrase [Halorubrum sp. RMP-47]|uniref:Site-specific integrase n=1 Tax=Halorubrum miltondacostae TaxID=3076378 RepID=A0ABD5LWC8_9EURY
MTPPLQSNSDSRTFFDLLRDGITRLTPRYSVRDFEPDVINPDQFSASNPFVCAYLETRSGRQLTEGSVETYEHNLKQYITFLEKRDIQLLDVELTDVIAFVEQCVDDGNRQSTIEGKLTAIRELYAFIRLRTDAAKALTLDPIELDRIDISEYNTPPDIEREPLSREELRKLFDAMDSYRNRLLAILAAETGLRNSDLRNIHVDDVDFDVREVHVRDPKNAVPYDVPISRDLCLELQVWCEQYRAGYGGSKNAQYLFPSQNGAKLETNSALNDIVTSAAERAGIQETIGKSRVSPEQRTQYNGKTEVREWNRVTVHTLRHTCLTLMKEAGVSLPYRQLVANHRNPQTTQQYSHGREQEFSSIRKQFNAPR